MMCLLWGQTEFAGGTIKVRNWALPRDLVGHLRVALRQDSVGSNEQ